MIESKRQRAKRLNAERQRRFREKQAEQGLVALTLMVPVKAVAEFKRAAELIAADNDLTIARLVSATTGKLRGLR